MLTRTHFLENRRNGHIWVQFQSADHFHAPKPPLKGIGTPRAGVNQGLVMARLQAVGI